MKKKRVFLVFLVAAIFSAASNGMADEAKITAALGKQSAQVNEEIHLSIKVTGVRGSLQAPKIPSLQSFEIFYSGRASHFSFINGRTESMTEFDYVLIPRASGRFILQPRAGLIFEI